MANEIKNHLYKIVNYCGTNKFIEAVSLIDLFEFIIPLQLRGNIISSISLIERNGKTPKVPFRSNTDYKTMYNKAIAEKDLKEKKEKV